MREGKFGIMQNERNFSYDVVFYLFWAPFATLMDLKSIYIFLPSIQRHKLNNDFFPPLSFTCCDISRLLFLVLPYYEWEFLKITYKSNN